MAFLTAHDLFPRRTRRLLHCSAKVSINWRLLLALVANIAVWYAIFALVD